jgi:CDP-4-dehydro-6-deoxyglucose reductase
MADPQHPLVTLLPSGKQFISAPHSSVLESGLRAGIALPYRCSNGSCGECRARIVTGKVEATAFHDYTLTAAEKSAGVVLLCSHKALTPIDIEVTEAGNAEDIPLQQLNTRICHAETIDDVLVIRLKILRGKALWFLAGQYANIHIPGCTPQLLPIATCPCEAGTLEFHISAEHTELQQAIVQLPKRERITVEGPHGRFAVDDNTLTRFHHVFVTVDTNFAVAKPMIEHIMATETDPDCSLLWVASNHYRHNLCRSWADAFDWFSYQPLSDKTGLNSAITALQQQSTQPLKLYLSAGTQNEWRSQLAGLDRTELLTDYTAN